MPRVAPADISGPQGSTMLGRVLGRRPEVLEAFGRLAAELRFRGLLPVELKEAVRRSTAADVGCEYCASIGEYTPTPGDRRESLAVAFARMVAEDHHSITDAHFDVLREEFTEEEIVELVALICLVTVAGQMFGAVMGVEAAPEHEIAIHHETVARVAARS
jgi:alkylhydroperoxidase family enzyme